MVNNMQVFPKFNEIFFKDGESILDVGCGGTSYESNREHDWWNKFIFFKKRVGMDIHPKEIEWRASHFPNDGFIVGDAVNIGRFFPDKSFDVVHCQNVIEHLEKDKAIKLIKDMENIAKKQVVLGTPKGFRQSDDRTLKRNPFEKHISEFTEKELKDLGYTVITIEDYFLCYKNLG